MVSFPRAIHKREISYITRLNSRLNGSFGDERAMIRDRNQMPLWCGLVVTVRLARALRCHRANHPEHM